MRTRIAVLLAAALTLCGCPTRQADTIAAQKTATAWLALTDSGQYSQSWTEASSVFKAAIPQPSWEQMVRMVRAPLGALKSRTLKSATYTRSFPEPRTASMSSSSSTRSSRTRPLPLRR